MVINSFVSGCPANVDSNLPSRPSAMENYPCKFTIPHDITQADIYCLNLFNRLENREIK